MKVGLQGLPLLRWHVFSHSILSSYPLSHSTNIHARVYHYIARSHKRQNQTVAMSASLG